MNLHDLETRRLLPGFMQGDGANTGLSAAVDKVVRGLMARAGGISAWDGTASMPGDEKDGLAGDLGLSFYVDTLSDDAKRELLQNADSLMSSLGTVDALERIADAYFGSCRVSEWFDYGAAPFHFRVVTGNAAVKEERLAEFLRLVETVKRKSMHFDGVEVALLAGLGLHAGVAYSEAVVEGVSIEKKPHKPGGVSPAG